MFEFASEIPLPSDENMSYLGITHDGHQTYLSSGDSQISILNDNCSLIKHVHTYCNYHTICYDGTLKRFWAASYDKPGVLFCLSENLEESEPLDLSSPNAEPIDIEYLFYDTNGKQLYLTAEKQVYAVDQAGHLQLIFEIQMDSEKLEGVCAYNHYMLCLSSRQEERFLSVHAISNGDLLEEQILSSDFKASAMTLVQDPLNPLSLSMRLLAVKEDAPFLIDYKPTLGFFTQYAVAYLTDGKQAVSPSNIQMQQLCGNRGPFPFFSPGCRGGNCNGFHNSQQNSRNASPYPGCPAHHPGCSNNCPHCCPDVPEHCRPVNNCCQSFADVIESIALTEASIAHILNAEGEKLQKAIACSRNVSELLCVNESVLKTITHSTQLEQMLYYKLESILSTGCLDCHTPQPPCCQKLNPQAQDEISDPLCE